MDQIWCIALMEAFKMKNTGIQLQTKTVNVLNIVPAKD